MIGHIKGSFTNHLWVSVGLRTDDCCMAICHIDQLTQQSDEIEEPIKVNKSCPDCLHIAAQIAEDKKELEK